MPEVHVGEAGVVNVRSLRNCKIVMADETVVPVRTAVFTNSGCAAYATRANGVTGFVM